MEQGKAEQTVDLWTPDKFNYRIQQYVFISWILEEAIEENQCLESWRNQSLE